MIPVLVLISILVDEEKTPTKKYTAVSSYDAKGAPGQVNLAKGEELEEVEADNGGWTRVRNANGQEGAVPTQILQIIHPKSMTKKKLTATCSFDAKQGLELKLPLNQLYDIINDSDTNLDGGHFSIGSEGRPEPTGKQKVNKNTYKYLL